MDLSYSAFVSKLFISNDSIFPHEKNLKPPTDTAIIKNTIKDHSAILLTVYDRIELTSLKISKKYYCSPRFLAIQRWKIFQFLKEKFKIFGFICSIILKNGTHSLQGWTATTRHGVTKEEAQTD